MIAKSPRPDNILRGILPVADADGLTWGTAPTDLDKSTNGNIDDPTGTGSKTLGSSGSVGTLTFDLGTVQSILINFRVGLWSDTGAMSIYIDEYDGTTWRNASNVCASVTSTTEAKKSPENAAIINASKFRLRFNLGAAGTGNVKIYEVMGYKIG